jgi:hypothetical protein
VWSVERIDPHLDHTAGSLLPSRPFSIGRNRAFAVNPWTHTLSPPPNTPDDDVCARNADIRNLSSGDTLAGDALSPSTNDSVVFRSTRIADFRETATACRHRQRDPLGFKPSRDDTQHLRRHLSTEWHPAISRVADTDLLGTSS